MTQLQLVKVDSTPLGNGMPSTREVLAVSSSWSALKDFCNEKYGEEATPTPKSYLGKDAPSGVHYVIESSDIVIVQENISKFN